jgi:transposase
MYEAPQIDAASTVHFLEMIERMFPMMRKIHLFLDNARYHHSKLGQVWKRPGRRIVLYFIPTYCPHINPIKRLWGRKWSTWQCRGLLRVRAKSSIAGKVRCRRSHGVRQ